MLFFLACFTNTHPSIPPQLENNISTLQQHVQRIEDLSNQLLLAQQKQDIATIQSILKELDSENQLLQKQKESLQQGLKVTKEGS